MYHMIQYIVLCIQLFLSSMTATIFAAERVRFHFMTVRAKMRFRFVDSASHSSKQKNKHFMLEINYCQLMCWIYLFGAAENLLDQLVYDSRVAIQFFFCIIPFVSFAVNDEISSIFHLTFSLQSKVYWQWHWHWQWQCQWQQRHQR